MHPAAFGDSFSPMVFQLMAWTLIIGGVMGTMLPMLPGTLLILLGAGVHFIGIKGEHTLSVIGLVVLGVLFLLSVLVDYAASAMGAKWFGASKWGMTGAVVGGIVGLFFGIAGLFLGPLIGAFSFELMFAEKTIRPATKSMWGTVLGTAAGIFFKIVIAMAMLGWIVGDVWFW